jgi:hypothetical protein
MDESFAGFLVSEITLGYSDSTFVDGVFLPIQLSAGTQVALCESHFNLAHILHEVARKSRAV